MAPQNSENKPSGIRHSTGSSAFTMEIENSPSHTNEVQFISHMKVGPSPADAPISSGNDNDPVQVNIPASARKPTDSTMIPENTPDPTTHQNQVMNDSVSF